MTSLESNSEKHRAALLGHPLRRQILQLLDVDWKGRAASPAEIAEELRLVIARAAYHLRVLLSGGAVQVERYEGAEGARTEFFVADGDFTAQPWVCELLHSPGSRP